MTVGELIRLLSEYDEGEPIQASWDCGCAGGEVVAAERAHEVLWLICD
jgi:hypothetical protein